MKKVRKTTIPTKIHIRIILVWLLFPASLMAQKMPEDNYLRGYAFYLQEKYDSAITCFDKSLKISGQNTDAFYYRGLSYLKTGNDQKAIQDFTEVDKSDQGRGAIWIARIYARENNVDEMLKYLDLHLRSNNRLPESVILLDNDFSAYENNRKWTDFWKSANYYTGFDHALAQANYLIKTGDYAEAADVISEGLKSNYRKAPLYAKRAEVYLNTGNDKQALADLNAALTTDHRNADLYARRADVNYRLGKFTDALDDYASALKYDPDNIKLYPRRALANSKNGLYDQAVSDMNFYLTYFSDDDTSWYHFGMIHRENHKLFDALHCFNKALSLSQADPKYFVARGETYMDTRTYKYAHNDFTMALDLDPHDAKAYFDLGTAAVKLGNRDEACYGFRKAYENGYQQAREFMDQYCK